MNNIKKVKFIDKMLKYHQIHHADIGNMGLCFLFWKSNEGDENFKEIQVSLVKEFPAIKFFAKLNKGTPRNSFWWSSLDDAYRIKTLKQLRKWYKFKSWFFN